MPGDQKLNTTERVFARDLETQASDPPELATTKRATDHAVVTAVPPARGKPSMFSSDEAAVEERLAAYGAVDSLAYTMGKVGGLLEDCVACFRPSMKPCCHTACVANNGDGIAYTRNGQATPVSRTCYARHRCMYCEHAMPRHKMASDSPPLLQRCL